MTRRAAVVVLALVLAALVTVGLLAAPGSPLQKDLTLGLDLQGGLEVTLQAVPPKDRELTSEDLDRSVEIMRSRVDRLGVAEPEIRTQGDDQIAIQLPGVKDPAAAAQIIGKTAQLELFDLETSLTGPSIDATGNPVAIASLYDLLARVQALAAEGTSEEWYVFNAKKRLVEGPATSRQEALKRWKGKVPKGFKVFAAPEGTVVIRCNTTAAICPGTAPGGSGWYLFKYEPPEVPQMTGADLKLSGTRADFDTSPTGGGRPIVSMEFTDKGADRFQEITRDEWLRGKIRNQPQHFAIVLDREIRTWPQIDYTEGTLSGGIGGGRAQITGLESFDEAKDIAIVLQTGALPVKFVTLDETPCPPRWARTRSQEAKIAAFVGLILVAFFLLLFYRFLGVVAVIGLGIYAALLYAAILVFNVTHDPAGVRRPRAHVRRGGRRECRHLRTHQGRGASRALDESRDRHRLHEGLPHDRRRQRGHDDHGPGALRRGDGRRARLRADAAHRYRDIDAHRRARDARPAHGALRASSGSTTRASWGPAPRRSRAGNG